MENKIPGYARFNMFFVLHVLSRYSDRDHPMSAGEITEKINSIIPIQLSQNGKIIDTSTVKRILDQLKGDIFQEGVGIREKLKEEYGFYIELVGKSVKTGEFISYAAAEKEMNKLPGNEERAFPKKYYYMEQELEPEEIILLKDALETYSYFGEDDVTNIVKKLLKFSPFALEDGKSKYIDTASRDRVPDLEALLLSNIATLSRYIKDGERVMIEYCFYNSKKELEPRQGYPKEIIPIHMMWSNGYYYLLAYKNEKSEELTSYRIDRIREIEPVSDDKAKKKRNQQAFNPVKYRHEHPIMFGGAKEKISLLCRNTGKNYIVNTIMDVFGKDADIYPADDATVKKYLGHDRAYYKQQGIEWLMVRIDSAPEGVELWATQYCRDCVVISPKPLAKSVKKRLEEGLAGYRNIK